MAERANGASLATVREYVQPLLYSPKEAAAALSLSLVTVMRMVADGRLKSVKIGAARRIPAEEINNIVLRGSE